MTAGVKYDRTQELFEDVDFLLSWGTDPVHIAKQVGRSLAAIEKRLRRAGRPDTAQVFGNARRHR